MAGTDMLRGVGFQQLHAVQEALLVAQDEACDRLHVEGTLDQVDWEVLAVDGRLLRLRQAKIRDRQYTWSGNELWRIFEGLGAADLAGSADLAFMTDGRLGTTGVLVAEAIKCAAAGAEEAEVRRILDGVAGLDSRAVDVALLRRCRVEVVTGVGADLVDALVARAQRLMSLGRFADVYTAQAVVDALFRRLFVLGERQTPERREMSRTKVLAVASQAWCKSPDGGSLR